MPQAHGLRLCKDMRSTQPGKARPWQPGAITAGSPTQAQACLPEDEAILDGALHCGVAPGIPVELVGGKLIVALQVHHLQAASGGVRQGSWSCKGGCH